MPLIGIRNELMSKQLMIMPVKGLPIHTTWHIIWLKGKKHSPVVKALLEYIKDNKKKILQEHFDIQDNMP
jgi:hypothetical protein